MEIESQPLTGGSTPHQQQEPTGCSTGGIFTFVMGLIAGTFSALLCKMAYDTASEGIDGEPKLFAKPIMVYLLYRSFAVHLLSRGETNIINAIIFTHIWLFYRCSYSCLREWYQLEFSG